MTPRSVIIDVRGRPVPQGSLRLHQMPGGKTAARYAAGVYVWRGQVQQAVAEAMGDGVEIAGAVELRLGFDLLRPAGHLGTGRNAGTLRAAAPPWPVVAPDLDKLVRCVGDAITDAGLWHDDAQVVAIHAAKRYVLERPGVLITVCEVCQ